MEKLNSYLGMAKNDYLFAKSSVSAGDTIGNYNVVVSLLAQAGEEYLKAAIEFCFITDDAMNLLHSHNLRTLYNKVITKYKLSVSSRDCKWLGDFYFDARYPGDNFVTANREDAEECLRIVECLEEDVRKILSQEKMGRKEKQKIIKTLSAFKE